MRIVVLSDIHSNSVALEAVFEDIDQNHQPIDAYWCLGDAIGYGTHPLETMKLLRSRVDVRHWAAGNHGDLYWGKLITNNGNTVDKKVVLMMEHNKSLLDTDPEMLDFISTLPSHDNPVMYDFVDGFQFILSHNGLQGRDDGYVAYPFPWCHQVILPELASSILEISPDRFPRHTLLDRIRYPRKNKFPSILLTGHTHIPLLAFLGEDQKIHAVKAKEGTFSYEADCKNANVVLLNPGSAGYPRDCDNRAAYLIIDTKKMTFEFVRVPYQFRQNRYNEVLDFFQSRYPIEEMLSITKEIHALQENIWYAKMPGGDLAPTDEWIQFFNC